MRDYQVSSFSIAGEENGPILDGIGPFQATIPATCSAFSGCPAQQGSANTPANFNRDGTIKIPRCVSPARALRHVAPSQAVAAQLRLLPQCRRRSHASRCAAPAPAVLCALFSRVS
jgi:hypothetical protein